ncbi:hypothetical protein LUD75_06745 [Epilithonimonas sp. JDS]|uniref:hypothetical protein n=1 Tax=Epilithonimonas sp. JDS TaxID=2902797 RepID=UPI001E2A7BF5|nr:hypothetical protein [Epilithonimonas sp. JDS]MCD9854395.1 hypothetical protein [Epilithonimonas sp. JDS]
METLASEKRKITNWINSLQDRNVIDQIIKLMNSESLDADYEAKLSDEEKVAYWKKVGISGDELFDSVKEHINTLPWKK